MMDNQAIAGRLAAYARQLEGRGGSLFRVQAYRRAVETLQRLDRPVAEVVARRGRKGLAELPGIGSHLAYAIERLVHTGEFRTVSAEAVAPEEHVRTLPGVGQALTELLADRLGVSTVEQLAAADRAGQLEALRLAPRRLQALREALAERLRPVVDPTEDEPPIAELLRIDREYRRQVDRGAVPTVQPALFGQPRQSWIPLLHVQRAGWCYRAAFSSSALAHRLGRTRDWVTIHFSGPAGSGQRTVVTETRGALQGVRVVRGREAECRTYYRRTAPGN